MNEKLIEQDRAGGAVPRLAFTIEEAAQALGISYISVWRLISRGKLRAAGGLRKKLIPVAELNRFLTT